MPLVLTQNEATASGHSYADVLGVSYEYPRLYQNLIRPGERFVYYRGRRRAVGGTQPQVYLGVGVVGHVHGSPTDGLLRCVVTDYEPFETPLPFKSGDAYYETPANGLGARAGLHFRRGVRRIAETDYERILQHGDARGRSGIGANAAGSDSTGYASAETNALVDQIAIELALKTARVRFPDADVQEMPHNNPGFDIRVAIDDAITRYIEVKGTLKPTPRFFLTEGERQFSIANSDTYSLWVFHNLDAETRTGVLAEHDGSVNVAAVDLLPVQYAGRLRSTRSHAPDAASVGTHHLQPRPLQRLVPPGE